MREMDPLAVNNYERLKRIIRGHVMSVARSVDSKGIESYVVDVVNRRPRHRETRLILRVIEHGPNKGRILVEVGRRNDSHRDDGKQKGPDESGPG